MLKFAPKVKRSINRTNAGIKYAYLYLFLYLIYTKMAVEESMRNKRATPVCFKEYE